MMPSRVVLLRRHRWNALCAAITAGIVLFAAQAAHAEPSSVATARPDERSVTLAFVTGAALAGASLGIGGAIAVGVAVGEALATVNAFLKRHPSTYVQLLDDDFRFADLLGKRSVPTTLVIDRRGRVFYTGGAMDGRLLAAFRRASSEPRDAPVARVPSR